MAQHQKSVFEIMIITHLQLCLLLISKILAFLFKILWARITILIHRLKESHFNSRLRIASILDGLPNGVEVGNKISEKASTVT